MRRTLISMLFVTICSVRAFSHCQVPCGIYDDRMRFNILKEHISTIEKAINEIRNLEKKGKINFNQMVRWIDTKENHAGYIIEIAGQYFLAQRIIVSDENDELYFKKLELLHRIIVYAMRTKQSADIESVRVLKQAVNEFEKLYLSRP